MAADAQRLRKFDPFQMGPDLVRRVAVGRDDVLRDLLEVVGENLAAQDAPPQHLCLIAPRGTGKTFLLRLLGLEIADRAAGGEAVEFLHLPEEMPHVLSPVSFLREIRRRLRGEGPAANAPRKHDDPSDWNGLATDIDADLSSRFGEGRGLLVLCVENIKDVLRDAFPEVGQQRVLRAWLERPVGRIMLIAASSAGPFDREADKALFAIGRNIDLAPWTTAQTMEFLGRVMEARDGRGLRAEDERIARAITSFTGGSPRMAVALAEVLGAEDALSAARTLDALIDNLQEYYLGRLKDMGREAKRCIGNLLTEGENVSQTEVARRLGMQQSDVAQIFRKLETDSVLISDRLAGHKEKFYRVADRVFVHFYNVRVLYHGAERSVLAPILDFLVSAFTDDERVVQAERLMMQGLRRDAVLLLSTLPVLDELTVDYAWWTGVRDFLDWVADVVTEREAHAGDVVAAVRKVVRDRGSAASIAHQFAHRQSAGRRSDLTDLVAGLAYLAAGELAQSRYWLAKISDAGDASWLICLVHLANAYNGYVAGDIQAQIINVQKAECLAYDLGFSQGLHQVLAYQRYISGAQGNLEAAERISKTISELEFPRHWSWLAVTGFLGLSRIAEALGQIQHAVEYAEQGLEIAERAGRRLSSASARIRLAECRLIERRSHEAFELADEAAATTREVGDLDSYAEAMAVASDALWVLARPLHAIEKCRELVAVLDEQGGPALRAKAYAILAWQLSSPAMDPKDIRESEARQFADRALAILGDSMLLPWSRCLALEARLSVAEAARVESEKLAAAQDLAPVARQVGRLDEYSWALAAAISARWSMKQNQACIEEAIEALAELVPSPGGLTGNIRFIATRLLLALRAEARLGELPAIFADLLRRIDAAADAGRHAALARAFLPAAVELDDYSWGVDLAELLLRDRDCREAPNDASKGTDSALACIAGAGAWERMAPQMDEAFWTAASAQAAEYDLAEVMGRAESSGGRAGAYAVFHGAWTAMGRIDDEEDPRARIMRALLTNRRISSLSAGLLTDIVGTLVAEAPGRFDAEAAMLRDFARFNAAGRDPAMLASLNPDVATALRLADSSLVAPALAAATPRKGAGKAKPAAKTGRKR
jgi:hypothetical protein